MPLCRRRARGGAGAGEAILGAWRPFSGQCSRRKKATASPRARKKRGGLLQGRLRLATAPLGVEDWVVLDTSPCPFTLSTWPKVSKRKPASQASLRTGAARGGNPLRALTWLPRGQRRGKDTPLPTLPLPRGHRQPPLPQHVLHATHRSHCWLWGFPSTGSEASSPLKFSPCF